MRNDFAPVEMGLAYPETEMHKLNTAILAMGAEPLLAAMANHQKLGPHARDAMGVLNAEREATVRPAEDNVVTFASRPGQVRTIASTAPTLKPQ